MLQLYAEHNFEGITTGDELWFLYHIQRFSVCDFSEGGGAEDHAEYFCQENYGYNFLRIDSILVLNLLPKGTKFNQNYFIDMVLPNL
jgi:hypothetical protein